MFFIDMFSVSV